jgi:protein tyrosine/serine phosphatase
VNVPHFIRRLFRAPYDGLRHYAVVQEGKLYRCGQPRPEELAELIEKLGLRTVISVRGERPASGRDAWEQAEREVCAGRGVAFVSLPCNHKNPPTAEQVEQFLAVVRDERRLPALIHCRIGQQRTGLFCALYRVHVEGVDPGAALREMDELGFNLRHRRHRRLLRAFEEFSGVWGEGRRVRDARPDQ